jgi:hypothetical protein
MGAVIIGVFCGVGAVMLDSLIGTLDDIADDGEQYETDGELRQKK